MSEVRQPTKEEKDQYLNELAAEVEARTKRYPIPPSNFDPRRASPDELTTYGFPLKPDRKINPKAFEFWTKLFSPPLKYIRDHGAFSILEIHDRLDSFTSASPLPAYSTRHESSENWSGAYISPRDGRMFTALYGSWQAPTSNPPSGVGGDLSNYRSSCWIGFDGQRSYLDSSLPQIGTVQYIDTSSGAPVAKAQAWFQWWERGAVRVPVSLPLPIKPSDLILCTMTLVDKEHVKFLIKNQTTGKLFPPFDVKAPRANLTNPTAAIQLKVSGATAEWILERPTAVYLILVGGIVQIKEGPLRDLPDYGAEVFDNCFALSAHKPGAPERTETLMGARLIDMYEVDEDPDRTTFISRAQRESDSMIATVYE